MAVVFPRQIFSFSRYNLVVLRIYRSLLQVSLEYQRGKHIFRLSAIMIRHCLTLYVGNLPFTPTQRVDGNAP